jgi:23S rRNA (uridine2552-2'-O)-methyltransferase
MAESLPVRGFMMPRGDRWEDSYTRRARQEKWLARSVYKLEEMDKKFQLIRKGDHILDLGCYPGSWSQYGIKRVGPRGNVVGMDLKKPDRLSAPNFTFIKADVFTVDPEWILEEVGPRDAVISDLAPKTTGIPVADTSRSIELAREALKIASAVLKRRGHFLCKVFEGEDLKFYREGLLAYFGQVRNYRPSAIRKGSREIYLLGLKFKKSPHPTT